MALYVSKRHGLLGGEQGRALTPDRLTVLRSSPQNRHQFGPRHIIRRPKSTILIATNNATGLGKFNFGGTPPALIYIAVGVSNYHIG